MSTQVVSFVGLGAIGFHMAKNLAIHRAASKLGPLLIWNRTDSKSQALATELGANKIIVAKDLEQVAADSDIIITNLANDSISKEIYGLFSRTIKATPPKPRIFVETSTVSPTSAVELLELITSVPQTKFIACPVFGAPAAAERAQLVLIMAGDAEAFKEVSTVLCPSVGAKVLTMGEDVRKAYQLKLVGNTVLLSTIEILAESQNLAEKIGLGAQAAQTIAGMFYAPALSGYGDKMIGDLFDGSKGFSLNGGIKDATHALAMAKTCGASLPALDASLAHMLKTRETHETEVKAGTAKFTVPDVSALVTAIRAEGDEA